MSYWVRSGALLTLISPGIHRGNRCGAGCENCDRGCDYGGPSLGGVGNRGGVPGGNPNRAPGCVVPPPPKGAPLPMQGTTRTPPAPMGWDWYPIDGAICRDGSPTGFFAHRGPAHQLLIFL